MRRFGTQMNCAATRDLTLTKQLLERAGEPSDGCFGRRVFDHVCHINFVLAAVRTSTSHLRGLSNSTDSIVNGSCTFRNTAACMFRPVSPSSPGRIVASLR